MKKLFIITFTFTLLFSSVQVVKAETLAEQLKGRILLQVESYGRAWYIDPVNLQRYYLRNGEVAYEFMRHKSLGISNKDLAKIPTAKGQVADRKLVERLKGRILLQVESLGEAWYVNPIDGVRYYLANGDKAYALMRDFGLGISNENLSKIKMNTEQVVHDTTFNDVAHVKYDGKNFSGGYYADQILPLASLTKLMTALVLLDTNPDWDKEVIISQAVMDYPKLYVGDDATSEVDLALGDRLRWYDLWLAMLVSSSNQATAALVEATGLERAEFVALMNDKAKQLGLTKTIFHDVAGLDAHNVTTPKEMAKIAYQAFLEPRIVSAGENKDYIIVATDQLGNVKNIRVLDRNYSLQKFTPEASKTGYLIEAQRTVALKKNGTIIVVMHALSMNQRNAAIEKLLQ